MAQSVPSTTQGPRWVPWLLVAGGVVLVAAMVLKVQRPSAPKRSTPLQARLELAAGPVTVDMGAGAVPAVSGLPLPANVTLAAGAGARALVRLSDGSSLFLRSNTQLRLEHEGISLASGEIWLDAPRTDQKPAVHHAGGVSLSAADAGLSLKQDGELTQVYVARGLASVVAQGGRVDVHAGEMTSVTGNQAPKVTAVSFWEDWTGGMADHSSAGAAHQGAGTLYGVDIGGPAGAPSSRLEISRQAIRTVIRDGLAETEVDQTFFNPGTRAVEGWYWFTVPQGAYVTGFALETAGSLVEAELIERKEAAAQYAGAVASGFQPALLEWVDGHTFRARIFPVPGAGSRRAVLRYLQRLPVVDGRLRFVHPLTARDPVRIGEFSLSVDLGDAGAGMRISTLADARVEDGGRRVTMRRSGFKPLADFQLELQLPSNVPAVRVARLTSGADTADYLMARYVPQVDWDKVEAQHGDVVLVVDTSAGGDDAARQLRSAAAEAVLRALAAGDRFALLSLDVGATVLHPATGMAPVEEKEIAGALEKLADHRSGGATDLASLFDVALGLVHGSEQPAVIYVGDGQATSGDMTGEQLVERLARALSTSRARFFTLAAGADANLSLLGELARAGGGQMLTVEDAEQTTERALRLAAAVKTPTITDFELDFGAALDEVFINANGKVTRGEEVVLLARSHHDIPREVTVTGRLGGKTFSAVHPVSFQVGVANSLVPKLWAAEAMRRLLGTVADVEDVRGKIIAMGLDYGLMTPFTSFLALESEAAYRQRGIRRRSSGLRGVRLSQLTGDSEARMLASLGVLGSAVMGCNRARPAEAVAIDQMEPEAQAPSPGARDDMDNDRVTAAPAAAVAEAKDEAMRERGYRKVPEGTSAKKRAVMAAKPDNAGAGGLGGSADGPSRQNAAEGELAKEVDKTLERLSGRKMRQPATLGTCSDVARRPLHERALMWQPRLRTATSPQELVERYESARRSCELNDWRAEARFLQLMQRQVNHAYAATVVLQHFAGRPNAQRYLARLIVRRAVDPQLVTASELAVLGSKVDWQAVDLELAELADPNARLARLRTHLQRAPDDARGILRLCRALVRAGQAEEALIHARRLRERGLLAPALTRQLGDLLARQEQTDEALRTYSEIVEFDPANVQARQLLGDIYLSHGWYEAAYRQFHTLTEAAPQDWNAWLRLAAAAAGHGRTDEALRLERKVAEAEGTPGPDDPRRWARLWSAARLARMMETPPKDVKDPARMVEALKRRLKEQQLFQGPGTLVLVTWEDLGVDIGLNAGDQAQGETTDAAPVGLQAMLLPAGAEKNLVLKAQVRGGTRAGDLQLTRQDIHWDGKAFAVSVERIMLAEDANAVKL